jgi:hypothetical protein
MTKISEEKNVTEKVMKHYVIEYCKGKRCTWNLTLNDFIATPTFYSAKSANESHEWLKQKIVDNTSKEGDRMEIQMKWRGKSICCQAFKLIYGISNNKWTRAQRESSNPFAITVHGNTGRSVERGMTAKQSVYNWIHEFIEANGDHDPTHNLIHIPSYIYRNSLYDMYISDMNNSTILNPPSSTTFFNIMDKYFSNLIFLRKTRLRRCDFCMNMNIAKKRIQNETDLEAFKLACKRHHELHTSERLEYGKRTEIGKSHPSKVMSIVTDCPDDYWMPNIVPITKETGTLKKLPIRAIGNINHSMGEREFVFYLPEYRKNPNLIISQLYWYIHRQLQQKGGKHAPILWIQADNCFKENKNRWILGFFSWLINLGWFREIMISYLPPGHSHSDIDQMFSTLSIFMDKHLIATPPDLMDKIPKCYKKDITRPKTMWLPGVWNWSGFFAPFLKDFSGIKDPHVFLFRELSNGKVGMKMKKWHSGGFDWCGDVNSIEEWVEIMNTHPTGHPDVLAPTEMDPEFLQDLVKYKKWISAEAQNFWEEFVVSKKIPKNLRIALPDDIWNFQKV